MKIKSIILSLAAVTIFGFSSCSGDKKQAAETETVAIEETVTDEAPAQGLLSSLSADLGVSDTLPVVIDFNATWCGPCKRFAPTFEAAAKKYGEKAQFVSVDVDEKPELAQIFGIESIPTVVYIGLNDSIDVNVGFMTADQFDTFLLKNF